MSTRGLSSGLAMAVVMATARRFPLRPGRPLQHVTNNGGQNPQSRAGLPRIPNSKPAVWSGAFGVPQPSQTRDPATQSENSWAQAMSARPTAPLDLSSAAAFPSLSSGPQPSSLTPCSSAWQTGPPQPETRRQPLGGSRILGSGRQQTGQNTDSFFSPDSFSRNTPSDFTGQESSQPSNRRSSTIPNGPPGLVQRPPAVDELSGHPSRVESPAGVGPTTRSPLPQNLNGTIGQERPILDDRRNDFLSQSSPSSQLPRDPFAGREAFDQGTDQTPESVFAGMPDKDRWGMKGYLALAEGTNVTFRNLMKGQELAAHGLNMNSEQPLLPTYTGPFAAPNTHPLRPLDDNYTIPECYTVKKVASLHSRINSFTDETLFYIFYSMPRDFMQVLVGQELMERKWRYHMREQMWMMRDETSGAYAYSDDRTSEQGYYIWWDKNVWKKVRRAFTLRYEDLDEAPNVGTRRSHLTGGPNGGANGNGSMFNVVPSLERMAARGL